MNKPTIEDLSWMTGSWSCEIWGGTFEEHWIAPRGGTMQATGRHISSDKTEFMEFLSIEPSDKGLTMWIIVGAPSKGDKKGVPFELTSLKDKEAVFENKAHDFPSKIVYTLKSADKMDCILTGNEKGKDRKETFAFAKSATPLDCCPPSS